MRQRAQQRVSAGGRQRASAGRLLAHHIDHTQNLVCKGLSRESVAEGRSVQRGAKERALRARRGLGRWRAELHPFAAAAGDACGSRVGTRGGIGIRRVKRKEQRQPGRYEAAGTMRIFQS